MQKWLSLKIKIGIVELQDFALFQKHLKLLIFYLAKERDLIMQIKSCKKETASCHKGELKGRVS